MQVTINETNTHIKADAGMTLTNGATFCPSIYIAHSRVTETTTDEEGNEVTNTVLQPADISGWSEVPEADAPREPLGKETILSNCALYAEGLKKVNFHGNLVWLTPDQRGNYRDTLNAAKALGEESITYGGVTMTIDEALTALNLVDVYAMRVTLKEQAHEAAIKALSDAEVEDYDYKTGYPTQLTF